MVVWGNYAIHYCARAIGCSDGDLLLAGAFPNTSQKKAGDIALKVAGPNPEWCRFRECVSFAFFRPVKSTRITNFAKQNMAPAAAFFRRDARRPGKIF